METYTITLTRDEMELLIGAADFALFILTQPERAELSRTDYREYIDIVAKLYQNIMDQEME